MIGKLPRRRGFAPLALAFFTLAAALLTGCASNPSISPVEQADPGSEAQPMIATDVYRDDANFFIRYRYADRMLYAGGDWRETVKLIESQAPAPVRYPPPQLVSIQYHQQGPWQDLPSHAERLPVLGVEQWQLLRNRLLKSVVPDDGTGLVVDFVHEEYFLFYDETGDFHATRLIDKPAEYRVLARLRFDEFMRRGRPILDEFLAQQDIEQTEMVFNTGDAGLYSLPFIYLNTERRLMVFIRNRPLRPLAVADVPGLKGGQAFGHMLKSHLTNLVQRPVSSLYRLFFVVTDTTVSTLSFDWATGLSSKPVPEIGDSPPMDLGLWERDLDDISGNPASSGRLDILIDGEAFFTRFIDSVTTAQESVQLKTYIFDNDDYAVKIGQMLKRRSNEGIDVKVLLDGLGTIAGTMADSESLPESHLPPPSVRAFLESDSKVKVRQQANPWFTGDHVKLSIVDRRTAFVGGMNVGREYRYDWHDLMLEIEGPVVDTLLREFHLAWGHAGPLGDLGYLISQAWLEKPQASSAAPVYPLRVLRTLPGDYEIYKAQFEAIRRAQSYIYIQNAYFTDDSLLRELVLARRRGVDVRVIMPLETDVGPIGRSNVLAANLMLQHGIRVYLYPGFSHVKAAIFDGWVSVGSANFDRLSLRVNRELNIASSDPGIARQLLDRLFEPDFRRSPELTEPIPNRWADHLVEIVGDYLY